MKLATLKNGSRDGRLVVVSRNLSRAVDAASVAPTMLAAVERWRTAEPELQALYALVNADKAPGSFAFDPTQAMAPLPRTGQFVDASAFLNHGRIMEQAYDADLLAHLAYNRNLRAGTILGSGTVSNKAYREGGSACLAERRAVEKIDTGDSETPFLRYGDRLMFEVKDASGQSIFGPIDHRFVSASA